MNNGKYTLAVRPLQLRWVSVDYGVMIKEREKAVCTKDDSHILTDFKDTQDHRDKDSRRQFLK